ncbi:MAG: hypothetical protein AAFP78_09600, partial [Pseudomonadota bacterium]
FGDFDIEFRFPEAPSGAIAQSFANAEAFWETQILDYSSQELADGTTTRLRQYAEGELSALLPGVPARPETTALIEVTFEQFDGVGGSLSAGGVKRVFATDEGRFVSVVGDISFDIMDIETLAARDFLAPVVTRRVGIALGFGSMFRLQGLVDDSGPVPAYIGEFGLSTYNREFDNTDTSIPFDTTFPNLPVLPLWDERSFGDFGSTSNPELFTRILTANTYVSDTSIATFDDLGYVTRLDHSAAPVSVVPLPPSALLLLGGIGILALGRTRKRGRATA